MGRIKSEDLSKLEQAIRESWCADTCIQSKRDKWTPKEPYIGQSGPTALVIQDHLEGDIAYNKKRSHVWNILPDFSEYDLTREQFLKGTIITQDNIVTRDYLFKDTLNKTPQIEERYKLLKQLVEEKL